MVKAMEAAYASGAGTKAKVSRLGFLAILVTVLLAGFAAAEAGDEGPSASLPSGCLVSLGACEGGACAVNAGTCNGGACLVNTADCSNGGACTVNTLGLAPTGPTSGTCDAGACVVNTDECAKGECGVNTNECNSGGCVVNFGGTCKPGSACTFNTALCRHGGTCLVSTSVCSGDCALNYNGCHRPGGPSGTDPTGASSGQGKKESSPGGDPVEAVGGVVQATPAGWILLLA